MCKGCAFDGWPVPFMPPPCFSCAARSSDAGAVLFFTAGHSRPAGMLKTNKAWLEVTVLLLASMPVFPLPQCPLPNRCLH